MAILGEQRNRPLWQARLAALLAKPWVRIALLMALIVVYAGWIGFQWLRNELFDFNVYYISAYGFRNGFDIYGMGHDYRTTNWPRWEELAAAAQVEIFTAPYLYPPLTAQLVVPLLGLSEQVAGMIWLALTALAFLISAWWLGKLWTQPEGASLVYLLTLGFVPFLTTLHAGQVNGFVLLALVAALAGLTARKAVQTGVALAIAALLKLLPLALCFYLVWRKQWRAAAVSAITMVALMLTAPFVLGTDVLQRFFVNFSATSRAGILYGEPANQGLSGLLARFLSTVVDASTIYTIYVIAALLVVVATVALCWPMRDLPVGWRLEFALILCAVMLIPPYNWYHMLVLLIIPLVVVAEALWRTQRWGLLALVMVLYAITDVHGLFYHRFEQYRLLTSFPCLLVLLLWGLLAWMIVGERRSVGGVQVLGAYKWVRAFSSKQPHPSPPQTGREPGIRPNTVPSPTWGVGAPWARVGFSTLVGRRGRSGLSVGRR